MDADRIKKLLAEQSRIGRRVILLLGILAEHGPQTILSLNAVIPAGLKGELSAAYNHDYVARRAEGVFLLPKGQEVVDWVLGKSSEPRHWRSWEDAARLKQSATKNVAVGRFHTSRIRIERRPK